MSLGFRDLDGLPRVVREALTAPPDPMHWNLILDGFGRGEERDLQSLGRAKIPLHYVPAGYLEECERAHGIILCRGKHYGWSFEAPRGHRTLEFNPTEDPRAIHLVDFVDEFETEFARGRLYTLLVTAGEHTLYRDVYGDPVVVLNESQTPDWLMLPDIKDPQRRTEAMEFLVTRTAPKLWGDVFSRHFRPRRVVELEQRRDELLVTLREQLKRLSEEIEREQTFYAPFVRLLYIGDEALKNLVARAFSEVFGALVDDLDSLIAEGEPKRLDLRIKLGAKAFCAEVRGSGNRNARVADLEKLDENLERMAAGECNHKLLIFNGMYLRPDDQRFKSPPFAKDVVDEAETRGIGLLTTARLLEWIEAFSARELSTQGLLAELSRKGLIG